jgi:hypothetical protein
MKKIILVFVSVLLAFSTQAIRKDIVLNNGEPQHDHNNLPMPADEPDVYLDTDEQEIIIDGPGAVSYYDVEIFSATNWYIYVSTQVSGSYDTIDISSLPQGEYVITIDSPTGNSFEGYFDTY